MPSRLPIPSLVAALFGACTAMVLPGAANGLRADCWPEVSNLAVQRTVHVPRETAPGTALRLRVMAVVPPDRTLIVAGAHGHIIGALSSFGQWRADAVSEGKISLPPRLPDGPWKLLIWLRTPEGECLAPAPDSIRSIELVTQSVRE